MTRELKRKSYRVAGLFAGIGGIELGLQSTGHRTELLCEIDPTARAVLERRFDTTLHDDVTTLTRLPASVDLVTAGFPCQDLSQAGMTQGLSGARSGLVGEVFRLIEQHDVPWVLLENVPFMLQLGRGYAMDVIVNALESLGYRWAYRVADSRSFGLPQRRRRVYLLASREADPRAILFADETRGAAPAPDHREVACGFYWTEGIRGLGWAVNSVPTLKGGSTIGIPSPPAIVMPDGRLVKPSIADAERLQGFAPDWTAPAERVAKKGSRWKLVGNAVSVPAARWIGARLAEPGQIGEYALRKLDRGTGWPTAAWNCEGERIAVSATEWPLATRSPDLMEFLEHATEPLSQRATAGFLERTSRSSLRFPDGFLDIVRNHLEHMMRSDRNLKLLEAHGAYRLAVNS